MSRFRQPLGLFLLLLGGWLAASDQHNALFISMGVVSAAVVTALTSTYVSSVLGPAGVEPLWRFAVQMWRGALFALWLGGRIFMASFQVARIVVSPSLPIDPREISFRTCLASPLAQVVLANAISMTPGTITMSLKDGELLVHAMVPEAADDILSGRLQRKISRVFGEEPDEPWDIRVRAATAGDTA